MARGAGLSEVVENLREAGIDVTLVQGSDHVMDPRKDGLPETGEEVTDRVQYGIIN